MSASDMFRFPLQSEWQSWGSNPGGSVGSGEKGQCDEGQIRSEDWLPDEREEAGMGQLTEAA